MSIEAASLAHPTGHSVKTGPLRDVLQMPNLTTVNQLNKLLFSLALSIKLNGCKVKTTSSNLLKPTD